MSVLSGHGSPRLSSDKHSVLASEIEINLGANRPVCRLSPPNGFALD